jgi:hypothetical protein
VFSIIDKTYTSIQSNTIFILLNIIKIYLNQPIVYQNTPFELQPEDGFIKKQKHVAALNIF